MGSRGNSINGEWGEWGSTSQCSRTCGGGTKFSERECNNPKPANGGRYCIGERKRYDICNTKVRILSKEDILNLRKNTCYFSENYIRTMSKNGIFHIFTKGILIYTVLEEVILTKDNFNEIDRKI